MAVMDSSGSVGSVANASKRGMVLPFQPLSMAFNHVNYCVDMPAVSHSFTKYSTLWCLRTLLHFKYCYYLLIISWEVDTYLLVSLNLC